MRRHVRSRRKLTFDRKGGIRDENGKLVTESLRDFTKKALKKRFASLDDFLKRWKAAERKQAILDELEAEGLPLDPIAEELGKDLDPFDLICHVAFDKKPLIYLSPSHPMKSPT